MIDTNVAIHLRDADPHVLSLIAAIEEPIILSAITHVELESGVVRNPRDAAFRRLALDKMLMAYPVMPFGPEAVRAHRHIVERIGCVRGKLLDRMIAAHAVSLGVKLITMNGADFRDVPDLDLQIWSSPAIQ